MKKKIYIECTHTYAADILTGIQRVVRNIVIESLDIKSEEFEAIPVIIQDNQFYTVSSLPIHRYDAKLQEKNTTQANISIKQKISSTIVTAVKYLIRNPISVKTKNVIRRNLPSFFEWLQQHYITLKYQLHDKPVDQSPAPPTIITAGDILFMLDSSWHLPVWEAVELAKKNQAYIIFAAYDLIPITHPHYCDSYLVDKFKNFYLQTIKYSDGYIAISKTIKNEVQDYISTIQNSAQQTMAFEYFYLGANLKNLTTDSSQIRPHVTELFTTSNSVYLIVSTIEPRKNHSYLIDTFDALWKQEQKVTLCIVGRVGWKIDELLKRIKQHPQYKKQLFMWHDINDNELQYCYKHAKALTFPSHVEGFGLPIIEALQNQLPVIASNTPIHREIGGDQTMYIDISDQHSLVKLITHIEKNGITRQYKPSNYHWLTWEEATGILLNKLAKMASHNTA